MELFTVDLINGPIERAEVLNGELIREFSCLHNCDIQVDVVPEPKHTAFICKAVLSDFNLQSMLPVVIERASHAIAEYILVSHEDKLIHKIITRDHGYKLPADIHKIEDYTVHLLKHLEEETGCDVARERRKLQIAAQISSFLNVNTRLNVDGFVRFRLPAYVEELQEVVEYAIDEYLMDKQYQEFIALLKYFVYIQDAKIPVAHLMHKGENDFILLNEELQPIETKQVETFVVEMIDKDINYEDMIVSTLITVSPQQVYIHTRQPEMQVIKTIMQIFEDRATICTLCSSCVPHLGDGIRMDQLST